MKFAHADHARSVIKAILQTGAHRATRYVSPDFTVKATRPHRPDKRSNRVTLVVSFGRPNFAERLFIRRCEKAGEPFPVRKIQLHHFTKRSKR
jgi:hypothetical protein